MDGDLLWIISFFVIVIGACLLNELSKVTIYREYNKRENLDKVQKEFEEEQKIIQAERMKEFTKNLIKDRLYEEYEGEDKPK